MILSLLQTVWTMASKRSSTTDRRVVFANLKLSTGAQRGPSRKVFRLRIALPIVYKKGLMTKSETSKIRKI